jgi:hypothetical protein
MMEHETILYISDQANSNPVLVALNGTGYEVVSTNSARQGGRAVIRHAFRCCRGAQSPGKRTGQF